MTSSSSDTTQATGFTAADTPAVRRHAIPRGVSMRFANTALNAVATSWFVVAVLGQLLFVIYLVGFYGVAAAQGHYEKWNKVLPHGFVAGDTLGNAVVSMHLLVAALIIIGGAMQLLPALRRHWPAVHRWNGRAYVLAAVIMSIGGLIMVWTRGSVGDLSQHLAISLNALVILACAGMAFWHARARRIDLHKRWALRLFLAVSGVWFFRIGLMFWIVVNQGPVGFDPESFTGPFLTFLAFAQYLLPLAVLQIYFHVQNGGAGVRLAMAAGLGVLTLLMAAGIGAATMIMWLPRL